MPLRRGVPVLLAGIVLTLGGSAFQACGGDDDPESDEDYVKAVCGALSTFETKQGELSATAATANPEDLAEDFEKLIRDLGNDLGEANPPADVKEAHESVVNALDEAADAVEEGGISALFDVELPTVELEPTVRNRVQQAFNTSPDCAGVDSIFS